MANQFITPSVFANKGLNILENKLMMGARVHTDYSKEFATVGETVSYRKQTQYQGQENNLDVSSYSEDITQGKGTITMDKTLSIKIDIGAIDATLSFDRVAEDVIEPAMVRMRDAIEKSLAATYSGFYHFGGTPGTVPSTFKSVGQVGAILTDGSVPMDGRIAMHSTDAALELADGVKSLNIDRNAKTALEQVSIGRFAGFENFEHVYAPTHTVGALGGTPLVNGGSQDVTYASIKDTAQAGGVQNLVTDGWSNSVTGLLKAGDVFTMAGVNAVNPVSKEDTGRLQTFVVLADVDSDGSGNATLSISPAIITSGAYQTVTAAPGDNAAITVKTGTAGTSYKQSLLLQPKAISLVTRPLKIASAAGVKTSTKTGNKVTISCTEWVDGNTLQHNMRFDMLWGIQLTDNRMGARLTS